MKNIDVHIRTVGRQHGGEKHGCDLEEEPHIQDTAHRHDDRSKHPDIAPVTLLVIFRQSQYPGAADRLDDKPKGSHE